MSAPRKVAVITGASDGLGVEFAKVFAERGHDLALVARRGDRLEALADEIVATGKPRPIVVAMDLAPADAPGQLAAALAQAGAQAEYLVNNAGYGLNGAFADLAIDDQLGMIDLNIRSLTAMAHQFLPDLRATRGGMLNVASVAAYGPGPNMAIYYASKAYVLSFTEALHEEMRPAAVRVTALCPGPVATGFQARAGMGGKALEQASGFPGARETVVAGYDGLIAGRRVVTPGLANQALVTALAWIPHAISLPRMAARHAGRKGGAGK